MISILANGTQNDAQSSPLFSTIYETKDEHANLATDPVSALSFAGVVKVADGRNFKVQHGLLGSSTDAQAIWRLSSDIEDAWLSTVKAHTFKTFRDVGKIRVGVKTCADRVFIKHDWDSLGKEALPELLRPLITHHVAGRFRSKSSPKNYRIL